MVPLFAWLRADPRAAPKIWMLVGFLVVEHGPLHLYMALDSWAGQWPGYTLGAEISLLDLREEDPFAQAHPLWAANLPLARLELDARRRIPRRDTLIVLYGAHEGVDLAPLGAERLAALGYTRVHRLEGGLEGWRQGGGELFRDVNVPSNAALVRRLTPCAR